MTDIPELLDQLIFKARDARASDIHIQPYPSEYRIRFRSDGVLYDHQSFEVAVATQICARIKVLSQLDVAEKRRPQDGSFTFEKGPYACDLRVATFPALYGEKLVLRLLDKESRFTTLDHVGLSPSLQAFLCDAVSQESGSIIFTGPTGSGKTTTAHALLATLNASEKNIVTLEDPIEYVLPGITQSAIQPLLGLTFEAGLRALLRQDPDVIMVGEIRDTETAHVAVQAALTGHQVITTLHTIDAPAALLRLIHLGCKSFLVAAAIRVVVAQRLARMVCASCAQEIALSKEQRDKLQRFGFELTSVYQGMGCLQCRGTGCLGRVGIFQVLILTPLMRNTLIGGADHDYLTACAAQEGMQSLAQDAFKKLAEGCIPFFEWYKVALSS